MVGYFLQQPFAEEDTVFHLPPLWKFPDSPAYFLKKNPWELYIKPNFFSLMDFRGVNSVGAGTESSVAKARYY